MNTPQIEKLIGYTFKNKNILVKALTHSSFSRRGENYEKLEFFGDSFLNFVIAKYLFENRSDLSVGEMTKLRAQIVCTENLRDATRRLGLWEHVRRDDNAKILDGSKKLFADIFESVVGAIYLDGGPIASVKFILSALEKEINETVKSDALTDFKTALQEYVQGVKIGEIEYVSEDISHNPQSPFFETTLKVGGVAVAKGRGESKKKSSQDSAKNALLKYGVIK
ncbi:MAG: ribonuclease III [Bacillota bacterium]